jgi:hypothetical protein
LPVAGIDFVGPLPPARDDLISPAAWRPASRAVAAALGLIDFLAGPAAFASIERAGMVRAGKDRKG